LQLANKLFFRYQISNHHTHYSFLRTHQEDEIIAGNAFLESFYASHFTALLKSIVFFTLNGLQTGCFSIVDVNHV